MDGFYRIVEFRFFVKFHRSGPAIIFSFWTITSVLVMHHIAPNEAKIYQDFIKMVSTTLEKLWMVPDKIVDFRFFVKFHRSGPAIIFSFWTITEHVSYASKKLLIKKKTSSTWCVLLWKDYGWFVIELSCIDFSSNFTGPVINFSLWTIIEHVSSASKNLLIKQKTSSTWCVLLCKNCGWCLIELSILFFLSQISQLRTSNNFQFLNYNRAC